MSNERFIFRKATKANARVRMAIEGPSGSGKTYSALAIASGLGGTVAFVDTESGSASLYAELFDFGVIDLTPPYSPERFMGCIDAAVQAGASTVIVDSLSHEWEGEGGLLEIVDQAQRSGDRGSKGFAAWKIATPRHRKLIEKIKQCPINIICCMRTKSAWVLEEKKNYHGRMVTTPTKVGTKSIQRDGMDYEFDVLMRMDADNHGSVIKTRCPALSEQGYRHPGEQVAAILREWLTDTPMKSPQEHEAISTDAQTAELERGIPTQSEMKAANAKPKKPTLSPYGFNVACEEMGIDRALLEAAGTERGGEWNDFRRGGTIEKMRKLGRYEYARSIEPSGADAWALFDALTGGQAGVEADAAGMSGVDAHEQMRGDWLTNHIEMAK